MLKSVKTIAKIKDKIKVRITKNDIVKIKILKDQNEI